MAEVSPLRRRMIEDMTIRNLSPATQQSYIYAVAKFSRHCRPVAGPTGAGGCACLPAASHRAAAIVVAHQPGRLRTALLLRRHAWVAAMPTSRSSLRASRNGCRWCSAATRSRGSSKPFPACATGSP